MKSAAWTFVLTVVAASFPSTIALSQQAVPEMSFESVPNFVKLPKDVNIRGEVWGISVNSKGEVAVLVRSGSAGPAVQNATGAQLLLLDKEGHFLRELGQGLLSWVQPHGLKFDKDDNLWAVDQGGDTVVRLNPEGRVTMVFGRRRVGGAGWTRVDPPRPPEDGLFRQPTDVTWDKDGNIYIGDGYINSRIAKFNKEGRWVTSIGEPGKTKLGELNTPHTLTSDAQGNIYVGDRENRRIQVIDPQTNTFVRQFTIDLPIPDDAQLWLGSPPSKAEAANLNGRPYTLCVTPPNREGRQFLFSADAFPGRIYKMTLEGKVVGWMGRTGRQLKEFGTVHQMACPSETELYVAELYNWRIQKLLIRP